LIHFVFTLHRLDLKSTELLCLQSKRRLIGSGLTHNIQHEDKGNSFVESIEKKLKAENIQCRQAPADRIDLFDILRALRSIILREKGNYILVVRPHICSYQTLTGHQKKTISM
jgi:hypothetical protein